jgi:prolipoprotein diacylglyceryltransferase
MQIAMPDTGSFFAVFYILSFAVTFVLIVFFSIRQKIPLRSVLLMLTIISMLTIIGSRLFTIPITEWGRLISSGSFAGYPGRSAVGGILFGLAGLLFSQRFLGIGKPILNLYAWIAPLGFGIQKIGCFFNGCCYGNPTNLSWSIQYPTGTSAHFHHWANGMIDESSIYSLGVHPVQLYEAVILIIIAYAVWRTRNIWKKNGSILIFSLFLFFIFRFIFEFLRDPAASNFNGNMFLGVRIFQWFLLISGIVCGLAVLVFERGARTQITQSPIVEPSIKKSLTCIFVVSTIIFIFRGLFTTFEIVSLDFKFIPAILLTAYHIYKSMAIVKFRIATTSFFVLPLFLISQTFPADTIKTGSTIKNFYQNEVKTYKRIDVGTSFGKYYSPVEYNPIEGECGTSYTTEDYQYVYRVAGAGYSAITKKGNKIKTSGINVFGGVNRETNLLRHQEQTNTIFGVNPYIRYDMNWMGAGVGINAGNLRWVPQEPIETMTIESGTKYFPVLPELYLRVGRRDIMDLKYTYGFNFPTALPVLMHEFSIGTGLGFKTDYSLRFGQSVSQYGSITFISAEGLVDKRIGLTFKYNFGLEEFPTMPNPGTEKAKGRILFGANYRFGFKK